MHLNSRCFFSMSFFSQVDFLFLSQLFFRSWLFFHKSNFFFEVISSIYQQIMQKLYIMKYKTMCVKWNDNKGLYSATKSGKTIYPIGNVRIVPSSKDLMTYISDAILHSHTLSWWATNTCGAHYVEDSVCWHLHSKARVAGLELDRNPGCGVLIGWEWRG